MDNSRIKFLDIAKGLGIVMVVWYHTDIAPGQLLNLFFMPLFFFISGIFFNPHTSPKRFFGRKIQLLIAPFILFFLLSILIEFVVYDMSHWNPEANFWAFGNVGNTPIWFLLTLSYTVILAYLIEHYINILWLRIFIYIAITLFGWYLSFHLIRLPLFLSQTFIAYPFFLCGFLLGDATKKGRIFSPIAIALAIFGVWWAVHRNIITNFHRFYYSPNYLPSFLGASACILLVLAIAWMLDRSNRFNWLATLGQYSLTVLGIHWLLLSPIVAYIYPKLGIEITFEGFSLNMLISLFGAFLLCSIIVLSRIGIEKLFHHIRKKIPSA